MYTYVQEPTIRVYIKFMSLFLNARMFKYTQQQQQQLYLFLYSMHRRRRRAVRLIWADKNIFFITHRRSVYTSLMVACVSLKQQYKKLAAVPYREPGRRTLSTQQEGEIIYLLNTRSEPSTLRWI